MRKKSFKAALIAAVVAVAGYGVYANQTKDQTMSDIMLENVDALAGDESGGSVSCCDDCKGAYCGVFYPADGSGRAIKMYYDI